MGATMGAAGNDGPPGHPRHPLWHQNRDPDCSASRSLAFVCQGLCLTRVGICRIPGNNRSDVSETLTAAVTRGCSNRGNLRLTWVAPTFKMNVEQSFPALCGKCPSRSTNALYQCAGVRPRWSGRLPVLTQYERQTEPLGEEGSAHMTYQVTERSERLQLKNES